MKMAFNLLTITYQKIFGFLKINYKNDYISLIIIVITLLIIFLIIKKNKKRFFRNLLSNNDVSFDKKNKELEDGRISKLIELALENNPLFYNEFTKIFQDFVINLLKINPALKASDLELCAMLKLNLDTKHIAKAKNATVKSIESKKYRLRKKLSIPSETDMYLWISKI